MDLKTSVRMLRQALEYMIEVRKVECQHKGPPDYVACARCIANKILELTAPKQRRTHEERWR